MKVTMFALALALSALTAGLAEARSADKMSGNSFSSAPAGGTIPHGAVVLVNDGTCGKGKIKRIVGGNNKLGIKRQTSCVSAR